MKESIDFQYNFEDQENRNFAPPAGIIKAYTILCLEFFSNFLFP
jgi:hypothetical protein